MKATTKRKCFCRSLHLPSSPTFLRPYLPKLCDAINNRLLRFKSFLCNQKWRSAPSRDNRNIYRDVHEMGKGKGRRSLLKKCVYKSPVASYTPVCCDFVFFRGVYLQKGDVVSLTDEEGFIYYAQIRGFLQDQYCEKSAVLTWLLPTQASTKDRFEPWTYVLGPEEDYPRKLEAMQFVCHAPSDYFAPSKSPFSMSPSVKDRGYLWTRMANVNQTVNASL